MRWELCRVFWHVPSPWCSWSSLPVTLLRHYSQLSSKAACRHISIYPNDFSMCFSLQGVRLPHCLRNMSLHSFSEVSSPGPKPGMFSPIPQVLLDSSASPGLLQSPPSGSCRLLCLLQDWPTLVHPGLLCVCSSCIFWDCNLLRPRHLFFIFLQLHTTSLKTTEYFLGFGNGKRNHGMVLMFKVKLTFAIFLVPWC